MLTFKREKWEEICQYIFPIWHQHYLEISGDSRLPLDPDWAKYFEMSLAGALHIMGARDRRGELVGYVFSIVSSHLHYKSSKCAFFDLYWLHPDYRKGMSGVRLIRETEKSLKAAGVVKVFGQTKVWKDVGIIFDRLGWTEAERVYTKRLD